MTLFSARKGRKHPVRPTVSVIIAAYNHACFLPQAIQSIYNQTLQDFEVIVVDDGSTDHTQQVIAGLEDPCLHYIYQANRGLAAARNTGLTAARGEYVALLDADDVYLPCKLEVQVEWLRSHPDFGFVAGAWGYIDEHGQSIGQYRPWPNPPDLTVANWLASCRVNPISVLVRRQWVERVGGFDESLRQVEDWDLWLRLAHAGCKMGWVAEMVCNYRLSPGQMTRNAAVQKASAVQMMDKFFNQPGLPDELKARQSEIYTRLYLRSAGREFGVGQREDAHSSLSKAVEYSPRLSRDWDEASLECIFEWEDSPYCQVTPIDYRNSIFDYLPKFAGPMRSRKRWALGEAGLKTFYRAYQSRDWRQVRRAAAAIAVNAPHRTMNRGYWSIMLKSCLVPALSRKGTTR